MNKKVKVIMVIFLALVVSWVLTLTGNPYKLKYKRQAEISLAEATSTVKTMAGYPAGKDILVAKSIDDIMNNKYCTIEVSQKNIESTRYFLIKDKSEAGNKNSKVGRQYYFSTVHEAYSIKFDFIGNIKYALRQILWNLDNTSYGEWCVVTLENGEKILVLVDLNLLNISKEEKVKLPIGKVVSGYSLTGLREKYADYGMNQEDMTWYVNMVGNWEEREVGDIDITMRLLLISLIAVPMGIYLFYKYLEKKGY